MWVCVVALLQAGAIHGDISQQQRTDAVEKFKSGAVPLLIATDVAARGLDIPDVEVSAAVIRGLGDVMPVPWHGCTRDEHITCGQMVVVHPAGM